MKRVFETAACEVVRNSIFSVQRYEKHENQMKRCAVELKVSDWQMNMWTTQAYDTVKDTLLAEYQDRHLICKQSAQFKRSLTKLTEDFS